MIYLLDTNVCVRYLNGRSLSIKEHLQTIDAENITVCSIVKAEMFFGAMRSNHPTRTLQRQQQFLNQFTSIPFDDQAAVIYGNIRASLASQGTPIGSNDLQIAAIALTHNLTLVTHNTREFMRVPSLRLEDWEI